MREIILILLMAISGHAFPIVGGSQHTCEETGVYKYKFEQGEKEGGVCSGSFISPKTFITAAHCVAFLKKEGSKFLNILNDKKYEIDTYHVPGSYHEHARISFILGRHYYQNCSGQYETQKCIDLKTFEANNCQSGKQNVGFDDEERILNRCIPSEPN